MRYLLEPFTPAWLRRRLLVRRLLTSRAVAPGRQRAGAGRRCLEQALRIAHEWPAHPIRLDAYDAPAGAGEFYRKSGFREVGRTSYRGNPLVYFETPVPG